MYIELQTTIQMMQRTYGVVGKICSPSAWFMGVTISHSTPDDLSRKIKQKQY